MDNLITYSEHTFLDDRISTKRSDEAHSQGKKLNFITSPHLKSDICRTKLSLGKTSTFTKIVWKLDSCTPSNNTTILIKPTFEDHERY